MKKFKIDNFTNFFFDFDGVFTDNKVILDQFGSESVRCNRNDGIGIDILKKLNKKIFIFSTEKNPIVLKRAQKLKVKCFNGLDNKRNKLLQLSNKNIDLSKTVYVGNDVNDYHAMKICSLKICPHDSHDSIKKISDFVLSKKGGQGIVTCMLEEVFRLKLINFY